MIEVRHNLPESFFNVFPSYSRRDSVGIKRIMDMTANDYDVKIIEAFKGNTSNLKCIFGGYGSTCDGIRLLNNGKYIFYFKSEVAVPDWLEYNLCTSHKLVLSNYSIYKRSLIYHDSIYKLNTQINWEIEQQSFRFDSLAQLNELKILRNLRDIRDGKIEEYFSDNLKIKNKSYKKNHLKLFSGYLKSGKREGLWKFYYHSSNNSHLESKGRYLNGLKVGKWIYYSFDGKNNKWIKDTIEYEI
jgi:hypothetical protein